MPQVTLRWANRSQSRQDWQIHNGDGFTLDPNYTRKVNLTLDADYTYTVAVTTAGGNTAATIRYTAATDAWNLTTNTPNEWDLHSGGGNVTVRCLLEDVHQPDASAASPVSD